jgi:hypothetical protein
VTIATSKTLKTIFKIEKKRAKVLIIGPKSDF